MVEVFCKIALNNYAHTTLDFIIKENNINKIRLLKIDIEGYELFALQGAQNTLEITDIVFFESWEKHYLNYGYSTKDVIKLLNTKGFEVYKFDSDYNLIKIDENYSSKVCENLIAFKNPKDIYAIYEKN
ncbi:MAG TPA: FkbM family methyltransferase [Thiotrichaceae bacterium]|nr:FkbM family methyltransferase [Thiotrichaceae bacterium]